MNDEYLWDRSGNDAEIERLECVLADLRYIPAAPPALAAAARPWWRNVRLVSGLATAAAMVMVVASLIYFRPPQGRIVEMAVNEPVSVKIEAPVVPESIVPASDSRPTYSNALYVRRRPSKLTKRVKQTPVTLTAEEKHAYDQVVLALYITGSKLRSVRDTIDVMEKNSARSNDR